jgi:APA family basic amino acid/polyamine antiporter
MARDQLFFRRAAELDPKTNAPVFSLAVQCSWVAALTLSGGYNDLPDYVIFAVLLFYILTIAGLFVLRRTRPDMGRPHRAIGYPVLAAVYIAAAGLIEVLLLLYKPNYTWPGLIIVLLGCCWACPDILFGGERRQYESPVWDEIAEPDYCRVGGR